MSSLLSVKNAKIPVFDGSRENFPVWWLRFQAFAQTYKFKEALMDEPEDFLPIAEDTGVIESEEEEAARKRNNDAVYSLTLALEKEATKFIYKGITEQWPSGQAHLIVKALLRRFRPRDATSELEFSQALMRLQLGQGEHPSTLFTQIADLSNRYGIHNHPEQQVIAVIMNAVPPEYRAVIAAELRSKGRALTLDEVEDCLEDYQRQVHPHDDETKNKKTATRGNSEITLSAVAGVSKGACWKCGESGHQKKDWQSRSW
jgi:hypothetical protein